MLPLLELFRSGDAQHFKQLDKTLERTVGDKERAVGAPPQHLRDHRCQPAEPI